MAAIYLPERRFRQPDDLVGVHPDWEGRVVSLIHFGAGAPVDVADQKARYLRNGSAVIAPSEHGPGLKVGATTGDYIESAGALAGTSGAATLVCFLPEIGPTQGTSGGMLWAVPAATIYCQISSGGAGIWPWGASNDTYVDNDLRGTRNRTIIMRNAGEKAIFVDRLKKTYTGGTSLPTGAKTVRVGQWSNTSYQFNGIYGSVAIIAGAITDDEAYQLVENPWGLYETEQSIIYSFPTGGIVTLNSLSVSNITSSGARFTVGLTR